MKKLLAYSICALNVLFMSTYYSISKGALAHIDAVMFACLQMLVVVPVALAMLVAARAHLSWKIVRRGVLLGCCVCLVLVCLSVALSYSSATETAFFPCLNGIFAALLTWLLVRQRVAVGTWAAALLALVGMALLVNTPLSAAHWRGNLIALMASLAFTVYIFLVDRFLALPESRPSHAGVWAILGTQLLSMAAGGGLVALLFGNWGGVHPTTGDLWALGLIGLNVLIPVVVFAFVQRYVPPATVAFLSILEPLLAAGVAYLYLGERFPPQLYLGGSIVFAGVLLQSACGLEQTNTWFSRVHLRRRRGSFSSRTQTGPFPGTWARADTPGLYPPGTHETPSSSVPVDRQESPGRVAEGHPASTGAVGAGSGVWVRISDAPLLERWEWTESVPCSVRGEPGEQHTVTTEQQALAEQRGGD
jgi:drug/metabolite transporter (DMT)-like permease